MLRKLLFLLFCVEGYPPKRGKCKDQFVFLSKLGSAKLTDKCLNISVGLRAIVYCMARLWGGRFQPDQSHLLRIYYFSIISHLLEFEISLNK